MALRVFGRPAALFALGGILLLTASIGADVQPFAVDTVPGLPDTVPVVKPWKTIPLDPTHSGQWVVLGDVDGDGEVEVVSARNVDNHDVHYTSAVCVQKLDGSVLWRWDCGTTGRTKLHHDVACQIYDWDGDGRNEVIVATDKAVVELDGATGQERRRLPIPASASDCLVFANLSGGPRATDFLVKTRYSHIWAYDREGKLLWDVSNPGGYRTSHQPYPVDIDGDGRDEIMAGYAMLNPDGSARWTLKSDEIDLKRGHLDCCRVLEAGETPADFRLVGTYCGANGIAMFDGNGRVLWELAGHHFESVDIGKLRSDLPGNQIVVDIDHQPAGKSPTWLLAADGSLLGSINTVSSRHHRLIDWNGDGLDEIVLGGVPAIYDGKGEPVARLDGTGPGTKIVQVGDMTGDGVPDVVVSSRSAVCIFRNERGVRPATPAAIGGGVNFTLY